MSEIMGLCSKCKNYPNCKRICRPVELILNNIDKSSVMEVHHEDGVHLMPQKKQGRFCEMEEDFINAPAVEEFHREYFNLEPHEELNSPGSQKAKIFYLRFFERMPYEEIADICDITEQGAMDVYYRAKKRVDEVLVHMDQTKNAKILIKRKGKLSDTQKMFICKVILGLTCVQIGRLFGDRFSGGAIRQRLAAFQIKHRDQLAVVNG